MKVLFALEDNDTSDFIMENKSIVLDELNVKSIERITNADSVVSYNIKPNLPVLGKKYSSGLKSIIEILKSGDNDEHIRKYESSGNIVLAKKLIDVAISAGANAVKFQKRDLESIYRQEILENPSLDSQGTEILIDVLKNVEFSEGDFQDIVNYCKEKKITFLLN